MSRNSYQVTFARTQYFVVSVNAHSEELAEILAEEELKSDKDAGKEFPEWSCISVEYEGPEEVEQV